MSLLGLGVKFGVCPEACCEDLLVFVGFGLEFCGEKAVKPIQCYRCIGLDAFCSESPGETLEFEVVRVSVLGLRVPLLGFPLCLMCILWF